MPAFFEDLTKRSDQGSYRTAAYLLCRVSNLNMRAVSDGFNLSPSRISKIQGEITRGYFSDSKLRGLIKWYKVQAWFTARLGGLIFKRLKRTFADVL